MLCGLVPKWAIRGGRSVGQRPDSRVRDFLTASVNGFAAPFGCAQDRLHGLADGPALVVILSRSPTFTLAVTRTLPQKNTGNRGEGPVLARTPGLPKSPGPATNAGPVEGLKGPLFWTSPALPINWGHTHAPLMVREPHHERYEPPATGGRGRMTVASTVILDSGGMFLSD